jgi:hypothetical protein
MFIGFFLNFICLLAPQPAVKSYMEIAMQIVRFHTEADQLRSMYHSSLSLLVKLYTTIHMD